MKSTTDYFYSCDINYMIWGGFCAVYLCIVGILYIGHTIFCINKKQKKNKLTNKVESIPNL